MTDNEKVIKGLMCIAEDGRPNFTCKECPYLETVNDGCCTVIAREALELLKEQQPLEVVYDINPMTRLPVSFCPKCGEAIQRHEYGRPNMTQLFCSYCGQAVKWD